MSASRHTESLGPQQGEFHSRVPPTAPATHKGHAPGVKVGNDALPEFHAETFPPGTAPESRSFHPQPQSEVPGQAGNPELQGGVSAADTLTGATSLDVDRGMGHPMEGMSSRELHGGPHKHNRSGLEGVGANAHDPIHERGFDREYVPGQRIAGQQTENKIGAEDRLPQSAEEVAHDVRHHQHHHH